MALCEGQLDSVMPQINHENSSERDQETLSGATASPDTSQDKKMSPAELFALNQGGLPLTVDYRSPVSHFIPPAVELYNATRSKQEIVSTDASESPTPVKRKRGRPRVDKTSPEYLAKSAARRQAREMAVMMNSSNESGEKRKRGRPRVDKTSPEYLARKRAKEMEALEKKAKRQYKRRATGDSAASSSGDATPRVKRKYTKRALSAGGAGPGRPRKNDSLTPTGERVKGKRGRPRKADLIAAGLMQPDGTRNMQPGQIRVRSNLMPINSEPISLDSDDEPDLGSPSQASDSLSLDENLRALRHLHEKYANLDRDEAYNAELIAANCKSGRTNNDHSAEADRVEKLEDSSNSDSDSSSSGSGSGSSCSSSSSSSGSSSSSSSDSEEETQQPPDQPTNNHTANPNSSPKSACSRADSDSDSDPERASPAPRSPTQSISESENESPDKSFQCHVCRKWYSTIVTLKIHRRSHFNRGGGGGGGGGGNSRSRNRSSSRYECDCCNETFSRREKLWEHKAAAHRGAMTVRCSVCRKCFEDEAELAAHDRAHTPDERAGRCSICSALFPSHSALTRHRSTAHGAFQSAAPHACPQCGKGFGHAHSLTRHLQNHARQLYKCVVCKASFAKAEQLAQHLNSHLANYKRLKP